MDTGNRKWGWRTGAWMAGVREGLPGQGLMEARERSQQRGRRGGRGVWGGAERGGRWERAWAWDPPRPVASSPPSHTTPPLSQLLWTGDEPSSFTRGWDSPARPGRPGQTGGRQPLLPASLLLASRVQPSPGSLGSSFTDVLNVPTPRPTCGPPTPACLGDGSSLLTSPPHIPVPTWSWSGFLFPVLLTYN